MVVVVVMLVLVVVLMLTLLRRRRGADDGVIEVRCHILFPDHAVCRETQLSPKSECGGRVSGGAAASFSSGGASTIAEYGGIAIH